MKEKLLPIYYPDNTKSLAKRGFLREEEKKEKRRKIVFLHSFFNDDQILSDFYESVWIADYRLFVNWLTVTI